MRDKTCAGGARGPGQPTHQETLGVSKGRGHRVRINERGLSIFRILTIPCGKRNIGSSIAVKSSTHAECGRENAAWRHLFEDVPWRYTSRKKISGASHYCSASLSTRCVEKWCFGCFPSNKPSWLTYWRRRKSGPKTSSVLRPTTCFAKKGRPKGHSRFYRRTARSDACREEKWVCREEKLVDFRRRNVVARRPEKVRAAKTLPSPSARGAGSLRAAPLWPR